MNIYHLYVPTCGTYQIYADYVESHEGSIYFYNYQKIAGDKTTLVAVYPAAMTIIESIEYETKENEKLSLT